MNEDPQAVDAFSSRLTSWLDAADALAAGRIAPDEPGVGDFSADQVKLLNERLDKRVADRAGMLRVLHDVTSIVNEERTIDKAFRRVLVRIAKHNGWCFGHIYVVSRHNPDLLIRARAYFEESPGKYSEFLRVARTARLKRGQYLPGRVLETGNSAWINDVSEELLARGIRSPSEANLNSAAAFPVKVDDDVLAVFEFLSDKELPTDQRILDSMASIGTHLGLFIIRKRMKRRIAELTTLEQQRIGRDLHDDLGQQLTGLALLSKSLERDLVTENAPHAERVAEIARGVKEAQTHVRLLAHGLMPVEIDAHGLMNALANLADNSSKRLECIVRFVPMVETPVENNQTATQLYRIAQEAISNAARHGKAKEITIGLSMNDEEINLEVIDDGVGISEMSKRRFGFGMSVMVYRANVIGGELNIESAPGGGTIVRCCVSREDVDSDVEYIHDN